MMKKIIISLIILLVVLITVTVWLVSWLNRPSDLAASSYSAVYLSTGDIYFGKLSWFPWPKLTNVWLLQRGVDAENQAQFSFAQFAQAFWEPINRVYLNPKQIIFWTRLKKDSTAAKAFDNPSALPRVGDTAPSSASGIPSSSPAPLREVP